MKVAVPLAKNVLPPLANIASAFAIDGAVQRRMRGRGVIATRGAGVVRAGKGITFVISNEDMDDIIEIIKSWEYSGVLIGEVSETVKHEIKRQEEGFLGILLGTLGVLMLENMFPRRGVMRAGKGVVRAGREYSSTPSFKQYRVY